MMQSAVLAMIDSSVRLYVCLALTQWYHVKTRSSNSIMFKKLAEVFLRQILMHVQFRARSCTNVRGIEGAAFFSQGPPDEKPIKNFGKVPMA